QEHAKRSPYIAVTRGCFGQGRHEAGRSSFQDSCEDREMGGPTSEAAPRHIASRQLVIPFTQAVQTEWESNALFGSFENDEGRRLGGPQLPQELVVHHHLGHAAVGQTSDKTRAADIDTVELQPQPRWQ